MALAPLQMTAVFLRLTCMFAAVRLRCGHRLAHGTLDKDTTMDRLAPCIYVKSSIQRLERVPALQGKGFKLRNGKPS
eukprot:1478513-Amphidinium_carterae.2